MAPETLSFITLDRKGRATLPEAVREAMGLEDGGHLLLERTERGTFELVPASLVPNDQLWFHHPDMQRRVAQAEAAFAQGRSVRTSGPEATQAYLDSLKTGAAKSGGEDRSDAPALGALSGVRDPYRPRRGEERAAAKVRSRRDRPDQAGELTQAPYQADSPRQLLPGSPRQQRRPHHPRR
jgi:AbrB family looped-hinge helix DNA binding protein